MYVIVCDTPKKSRGKKSPKKSRGKNLIIVAR